MILLFFIYNGVGKGHSLKIEWSFYYFEKAKSYTDIISEGI